MDRTPNYLKTKFLSVLGSSNDLISGLTTKLDISNLSSSSDVNTNDFYSNKKSGSNLSDVSLDENIIDFEARKVKERRAQDEVSTGKYRHPSFITKIKKISKKTTVCNMIDINAESSISNTNSNSLDTKSEVTTKDDVPNENITKDFNMINSLIAVRNSISEYDIQVPSASDGSVELKKLDYSNSNSNRSVQSLKSISTLESHEEDDTTEFMRRFVDILFEDDSQLTQELKSEFGTKSQTENGRFWFARFVNAQRSRSKRVSETTFYSLIQHFAIVLFECKENDDFSPAKILMNMCFTYFYEVDVPGCEPYREYLYIYLRYQPIWHALRFWNAAYFDAVQCERNHRPVPQTYTVTFSASDSSEDDLSSGAQSVKNHLARDIHANLDVIHDDAEFQQNICFGQLGTFTCNMHAFGLSKELCDEFLRKQCVISNISNEQERMLKDNMSRLFKETAKWRAV